MRLSGYEIHIEYRLRRLNLSDAPSYKSNYDAYDENSMTGIYTLFVTSLHHSSWPSTLMISPQTSKIKALYIKLKFSLVSSGTESSSWNFVFLGSKRQKEIVSRDSLKNTSTNESAYAILSPEM